MCAAVAAKAVALDLGVRARYLGSSALDPQTGKEAIVSVLASEGSYAPHSQAAVASCGRVAPDEAAQDVAVRAGYLRR